MNEYLEMKFNYLPKYKSSHVTRKIKKTLTFIGLWIVWFIILIFLNENHYSMPVESYVFIGVTIIIQVLLKLKRNKVKDKLNEMLDALSSTYNNCANLNISWSLIWDSMIKSKDKMIVWDNLVFALVEKRKA